MYISEPDKGEIRNCIERQLKAFQEDDAEGAFAIASPAIQQQFVTAENFLAMVKKDYHVVYHPRSVMFRGFTSIDDFPAQIVMLMDEAGTLVKAVYIMQQQRDDLSWRIHGCMLVSLDESLE
ncbi:DUF4864 domain-containing protein [Myxosarcina sp. GI1]|uniref:DUF4864 domain-containing protein n=1 Tax=Myxosarcina sp. GI1 TaxID=1541065 RepID=UPI00056B5F9A|nr:DUF4864 domain-containing protein [Myxosarcina sp. GI1]